jgi:hypothetical protein
MFSRQLDVPTRTCPTCGSKLASERDLLRCDEHGTFFVYGPQLLVRAPRQDLKLPGPPLSLENRGARFPR